MSPRPKPRIEFLPVERLTFDLRLQLRDIRDIRDGSPCLYSEKWVHELLEAREQGEEFEALEVVEETRRKAQPIYWVFAGFHRGEALRRCNVPSVQCRVYPGTFADAELYALSQNAKQPLPRTPDDCWKAFKRLIDSPSLLSRVLETAHQDGGIHRSLARAAGLSHGVVGKYLERAGLRADRDTGKLVAIPVPAVVESLPLPPAPEPEPEPEPESEPAPARTEKPKAAADGDPELSAARDALAEIQKALRIVVRHYETLLTSQAGDHLRNIAHAHDLPLRVKEQDRAQDINDTATVRVEYWPTLTALQQVFGDLAAVLYATGKAA